jgi:tRNA dimethylallyltransferase
VANPLIVITGPTASGKTGKAVALARALGGEIISADSRQVYRGMDIGTGKDLDEYGEVPYHLIDICDAGYKYNLFEYVHDYGEAYADIVARGRKPILCGGTGLYLETVLKGVSLPPVPENKELRATLQDKTLEQLKAILERYKTLHNVTDFDTAKRAIRAIEIHKYYHDNPDLKVLTEPHPVEALIIGLDISREERRERITARLKARFSSGMVDEIRRLVDSGVKPENLIYYGLEYKFITQYVIGEITYDEMFGGLETAIHQFAKRQMTWFRGMERRGFTIHWLPYNLADEEFVKEVKALLN